MSILGGGTSRCSRFPRDTLVLSPQSPRLGWGAWPRSTRSEGQGTHCDGLEPLLLGRGLCCQDPGGRGRRRSRWGPPQPALNRPVPASWVGTFRPLGGSSVLSSSLIPSFVLPQPPHQGPRGVGAGLWAGSGDELGLEGCEGRAVQPPLVQTGD